jgi:hypothetical protein
MPTFQKSTYLDSPKLINFFVSIYIDASLPQIGQYKTRLGTLVSNFGELFALAFHNLSKAHISNSRQDLWGKHYIASLANLIYQQKI